MSGGASAFGGFIYQQDYFAYRALASVAAKALGDDSLCPIESFSIEGRTSAGGPVWDLILRFAGGGVELTECKDTTIEKEDRITFYRRVRDQVAAGTRLDSLRLGWATDPEKQKGNILAHLEGMASAVDAGNLAVPTNPPEQVNSPGTAVAEALYYLSGPAAFGAATSAPVLLEASEKLLRSLTVARWSSQDLKQAVSDLAREVFESGTPDALLKYINGHLSREIRDKHVAADTLQGFLDKVGTVSLMGSVTGLFREFLDQHSAAAVHLPKPETVVWERLPNAPAQRWEMRERLPDYSGHASHVVIARQGVGKTVLAVQAFHRRAAEEEKHRVLLVHAALFHDDYLARLASFCTVLSGLGPTWLAVDGLDEIAREDYRKWLSALNRLVLIPNLTLLLTTREEVLEAGEWLQRLTATLPSLVLKPLDPDQVEAAFRAAGLHAPKSGSLLTVLQNPFLLSLYAKIVTPDDMPLEASGGVTAFRVVSEFWRRRVRAPSSGHRLLGPYEDSASAKRLAVEHLACQTREGIFSMRRPGESGSLDRGIQMLMFEGVLSAQGTHGVRWTHDWFREYALIDLLVAEIQDPGPRRLAQRVADLGRVGNCPDHVTRLAAVGGAKWVVTEPGDWGPVGEYLLGLHESQPGLVGDALATLIEGPAHVLELVGLHPLVLLQAVQFAKSLRARQWAPQITNLPPGVFRGEHGPRLHQLITDYELEVLADE